jgi:drug/metabolite transporter (DMT)-like permease
MGIVFALLSAVVWGSGDYAGGVATRRGGQLQVLAISALSGAVVLLALGWLFAEPVPSARSAAWAAAAGLLGAVGLASLYRGLAIGRAATVAPTAAVITAAVPFVFSSVTAGLPHASQLAGFALAIAGIWLVARTPDSGSTRGDSGLALALVAGCGFGGFLTLIAQVDLRLVFGPLAVARAVMVACACVLILARRGAWPSLRSNPIALLAGTLDAGGNVFYMLARQHVRLDVAAVLSSLYPVATVVLARVVSREPIATAQWIGAGICLAAIGLITV